MVSHDYWGTLVTYIGYFLMFLGMIFSLLNPNSRFRKVIKLSSELQEKRKSINKSATVIILILFGLNGLFSSSYASDITIIDPPKNTEKPYRIFMNNILKYKGYRIFQSSYDSDEKGTILLVSHDYWGTLVTYIGYFLMFLGMTLSLLNPNSRFRKVIKLSSELQEKRKSINKSATVIILILFGLNGFIASASAAGNSKEAHFKNVSQILVQDYQGRIEPLSTLSSELLRKIYKKSEYCGKSAVEVFVEMNSNPDLWKNEPIIKVGNDELRKQLKIAGNYISFNQLFDFENEGAYRIQELVEKTYQKSQQTRNKFDKEVINLDERVNICYQIFNGEYMETLS